MKDYVDAAILESIQKSRVLKSKFPRAKDSSLYFDPLISKATVEIDLMIERLADLLYDQDYSQPQNLKEKFGKFKSILSELHVLENIIVAAISRKHDDDEYVNKLVRKVCSEIEYPVQPPVVSCLSQHYYQIFPYYNFMCMPLLEADFLLHLPDLYHELCHPLISVDNPTTEPLRISMGKLNRDIKKYFNQEITRLSLNKFGENNQIQSFYVWRDSWIESWSEEFFCDLFATYTLGPAFVWSNLHMCAKMDWNLFGIPYFQKTSHPPAGARMQAMFHALDLTGFSQEKKVIEKEWNSFIKVLDVTPETEYHIALPDQFLQNAATYSLEGIQVLGCKIASDNPETLVIDTLNSAWHEFWKNPGGFTVEEQKMVKLLKRAV
ncbi:hypothetical protein FHS59_000086 [Algoriphagus iocasae]|uniref:Uncharacterized protein n=1 Tax=Algoriphagus iocasae TaxID=1836499 RepID=A0A841MR16_9BACT|nr:hypothetical protein [Algoriphagus iocasae]MBB6324471.1 hypothetical protein [Algoriphagus iocasae]